MPFQMPPQGGMPPMPNAQRPLPGQWPGMARGLAAQPMRGAPMQEGAPPSSPQGQPMPQQGWQPGMGNGWLQQRLQAIGQRLGAQAWPQAQGQQPPAGAGVIDPRMMRPQGNPDRGAPGAQTDQQAQQYARGAMRGMMGEPDADERGGPSDMDGDERRYR